MRLTPEAKHLLALLAEKLGVSQAAALELAIREQAKREHVAPEKPTHQRTCTAAAVD
jgi:hypothetical protein